MKIFIPHKMICLVLLVLLAFLIPNISQARFTCTSDNDAREEILYSQPLMMKNDGRPKATAGALLYIFDENDDGFILLGQEQFNPDDTRNSKKYSEFSGSMKLTANGSNETFIEGSARELNEETAGIYNLSNAAISNAGETCYEKKHNRETVINIIEAPFYTDESDLLLARNKARNEDYKDTFKWVKIADLLEHSSFTEGQYYLKDINGEEINISFRPFFLEMLNDKNFKNALNKVTKR